MGHDAFEVGSYKKPNIKLHVIIFLTIIGVSVFLSTQVEKTRKNTRVEALRNPVSIDSVFVDEASQQTAVNDVKPVVTPPQISEPETEYRFEKGPNLQAIDNMLAKAEPGEPVVTDAVQTEQTTTGGEEILTAQNVDIEAATVDDKKVEREKDVAIMVAEEESKPLVPREKLIKAGKLDTVYELQQDRFLETLAKTANQSSTEETVEVKRMKDAMRNDRPLTLTSTSASVSENDKSVDVEPVRIAATKTVALVNNEQSAADSDATTTSMKKSKIVISKAAPVVKPDPATLANPESSAKTLQELTITKGELNNILSQFARSYNQGDIKRLMALFDENAITNDQKDKTGIQAEYADLFRSTTERDINIKDIHWDLGKGKAKGDARFTVLVKPMGSTESARIEGKIEILAIKEDRGVFIKSLMHEVSAQ